MIVLLHSDGRELATLDWDIDEPQRVMHFDVNGVDDDFEYEGPDGDDYIYRRMW